MDMKLSTNSGPNKAELVLEWVVIFTAIAFAGLTLFGFVNSINRFEPHLIERLLLGGPVEVIDVFDATVPAQEVKNKKLARHASAGDLVEAQCVLNDTPQNNVETQLSILNPDGKILYSDAYEIHIFKLPEEAASYKLSIKSSWLERPVKCKLSIFKVLDQSAGGGS